MMELTLDLQAFYFKFGESLELSCKTNLLIFVALTVIAVKAVRYYRKVK